MDEKERNAFDEEEVVEDEVNETEDLDEGEENLTEEEVEEENEESEEAEESEDSEEFTDDDETEEEDTEEKAEEDTKQNNSFQAQKRREREAREEKIKREAFVKGMIEALGGENPYTGEKIEDSADVDEYLMMRDLEKQGHDPVADYHKAVKRKAKETASQEQEEIERKQEISEFAEKYPNVDMQRLLSNERFVKFAGKRVGRESLSDIYADYLSFTSEYDAEATRKAEENQRAKSARKKASPGSLTGNGGELPQKTFANMTDDEFEREIAKAKSGAYKRF